jgi:hypothetical protein
VHINRLIEQFLSEHAIPPTRFGRMAVRDPRLVFDMRRGRTVGPALEQHLREFIARYPVAENEMEAA